MNLYEILWLQKSATKEEIKKAYRKLAMQYHPDRNKWDKEAEKKFKEISGAYSILSDDSKRQQYDRFWTTSWWWNPFQWWWFSSSWIDVDLWDIFDSFFWWSSWWTRKKWKTSFPWEDLEYNLNIDLKISIYGWEKIIKFNKKEICNKCGWEWWTGKKVCDKCRWTWQIKHVTQSMFWTIQQTVICDECSGSWESFEKICTNCNWKKRITIKKEIKIDIPAWIDNWMLIKLTWEWNHGINTKAKWDLYIKFWVQIEEKWLKREWINLYYDLEIHILEAILWTTKEINIPIIWKRKIEIKWWTQHLSIIKITWNWVKNINNDGLGDLYIKINIKIPKKLQKQEKQLYEKIAEIKQININKWWVFKKMFW